MIAPFHWPTRRVDALAHAIEAHSFSANITPVSPEAKILQDADRLDAIGAIGVARCFYVDGRTGALLYDPSVALERTAWMIGFLDRLRAEM